MQESTQNGKLIAGIVAVTGLLFVGFIYAVLKAPADPGPVGPGGVEEGLVFTDEGHPFQGPEKDAKVTVQIYGDFQCPACRAAEAFVKPTIERFRDLGVKFVWKDFPLPMHRNARSSALAARCAHEQGWFWTYHDTLYAQQSSWENARDPQPVYERIAQSLAEKGPYNHDKWKECMSQERYANAIQEDVNEAMKNRVNATPTFFVGNRRIYPRNAQEFAAAIEAALPPVAPLTTSTQP